MIKHLTFRTRISLLVIATCTTLAVALISLSLVQTAHRRSAEIRELRSALYSSYDTLTKTQVQAAISVLKSHYLQVMRGEITEEHAQRETRTILREMRYMDDQSGYFWVDTINGVNIIHGITPEIEGNNRLELKDAAGNPVIRKIIAQGRKPEGGFTDYLWSNTPNEAPRLKRSYSSEFKPWGWVVGTGNYVDDIEALIRSNEARLHDTLRNSALAYGITAIIITLFALWLAKTFITKEMEKIGGDPERDQLTGSLSRMKLLNIARERRAKLIAQRKTLSVALLDVDHFKRINDTYGHSVGDLALRHIVTICSEVLRASDYFGRYGGEEFLFIFPNADASVSLRIAERIREIVENSPLALDDGRKLFITVSLGIATLRPETDGMHDTIEHLIDCADKALYRAKEEGRNRTRSADIKPDCA